MPIQIHHLEAADVPIGVPLELLAYNWYMAELAQDKPPLCQ